jgi:hypothetical protein
VHPYAAGVSIGDELWSVAEARDPDGLLALLETLDDDHLAAARVWYRSARPAVRRDDDSLQTTTRWYARCAVEAYLAVWLGPPGQAAQDIEWTFLNDPSQTVLRMPWLWASSRHTPLVRGVVGRGRDWTEAFVLALDERRTGSYAVLRQGCDAFELEHPGRRRVLTYGLVIDDRHLDAIIDMVVRLLLSHVVHPAAAPADTADDLAWILGRTLGR